jgi:hypothetical protein
MTRPAQTITVAITVVADLRAVLDWSDAGAPVYVQAAPGQFVRCTVAVDEWTRAVVLTPIGAQS